jgi:8-oxoguanine deaminase
MQLLLIIPCVVVFSPTLRPTENFPRPLQDIQKLATFNNFYGEIDDGAIFVKGNVIEWVGRTSDLPEQYSTADEVISLPDHVIIPGLVNTHHHMFALTLPACQNPPDAFV